MSVKTVTHKVCEARCKEAVKGLMDVVYDLTSEKEILSKSDRLGEYIVSQIEQGMVNSYVEKGRVW